MLVNFILPTLTLITSTGTPEMTYDETLRFLYSLEKFGIRFGLENISLTLNLLQNPHQKFKSIHIAGTNGKGSTAAMIASILQHAGYKTALYTSPHLQDFRERIRINGFMIPEEDVIELTERINYELRITNYELRTQNSIQLTFFEFTTAMAFLYFAREKVDFAVVEVGMGGRLDATNVLNPVLSIITEIDIEHTEHLGEDIKSITREKGGITKDYGTVILSSSKQDVIETIESLCKEKNAKLYRIGKDYVGEKENTDIHSQQFKFIDRYNEIRNPQSAIQNIEIPLLGKYQIINASTAVKAALILPSIIPSLQKGGSRGRIKIDESAVREGLKNVKWNGRLEIVSENPIIILDGAHNPAAARALSEELEKIKGQGSRVRSQGKNSKLILIIGILKDKDYKGIISFLAPIADYIIIAKPKTLRAREPEDLKTESLKYPPPPASPHKWGRNKVGGLMERVVIIEEISEAVKKVKSLVNADDIICITGSFFTVGEARKIFDLQN